MQITVDPSQLTKEQRECLASFIMVYPGPIAPQNAILNEQLKASIAERSPEEAFGDPAPVAGKPTLVMPPPVATPSLDSAGLPWDARIHSSQKATNVDGTWRKKRNVEDAVVYSVEGELRALMAVPQQPLPATTVHPTIPAPPPPEPVAGPPIPVATGGFQAVTAPTPVAPVAAASGDRTPFINLVRKCSEAVTAKRVTNQELNTICLAHGVPSVGMTGHRMDLIPAIESAIDLLLLER